MLLSIVAIGYNCRSLTGCIWKCNILTMPLLGAGRLLLWDHHYCRERPELALLATGVGGLSQSLSEPGRECRNKLRAGWSTCARGSSWFEANMFGGWASQLDILRLWWWYFNYVKGSVKASVSPLVCWVVKGFWARFAIVSSIGLTEWLLRMA